jgi:hypothetical protein
MNRLNLDSIGARMAARSPSVAANITDFRMVTPTLAKVVATFNTVKATPEVLAEAVGRAMNYAATPVAHSWRELSTYGQPAMVGFVSVNRETRAYDGTAEKAMTVLSSNMLMDAKDDSLWEIRQDGSGGKMLCRQAGDSLQQLMETAKVRQPRSPKLDNMLAGVDTGNFISYVDPVSEEIAHGYVLATDLEIAPQPAGGLNLDPTDRLNAVEVLPLDQGQMPDNSSDESVGEGNRIAQRMRDENAPVTIPCSVIIESAALNGDDRFTEVAAPANMMNKQSLLDYYKRNYVHAPEYYGKLVDIINNHAGF